MLSTLRKILIPSKYQLPARYIYHRCFRNCEDEFLKLKDTLKNKTGTAIDIGANAGLWSYRLAQLGFKVEAFEPQEDITEDLKNYKSDKITIHNVALSSNKGELELQIPIINGEIDGGRATFHKLYNDFNSIVVPVDTLDNYNFKNVSFMKIDVEGHEMEVINGAEKTLTREKPVLIMEIEQRHFDFPMKYLFDKILAFGYEAFISYNGERHLYKEDELKYEVSLDNMYSKQYLNNFIFIPK